MSLFLYSVKISAQILTLILSLIPQNMRHLWPVLFSFLFLVSCNNSEHQKPVLNVAVASNMQIVMEEIALQFNKTHGIEIDISSGSSGVLTAQIRNGAPFHVFVSANMRYPKVLEQEGLTLGKPKIYAHGTLILWSLDDIKLNSDMTSLTDDKIVKFAVANPEIAPYGIAGMQALENSKMIEQVPDKLVKAESIGQVNQYISSRAVQVGLTSLSVLYSSKVTDKGSSVIVDRNLYEPINQGIVILENGFKANQKASQLFYDFMFSPETQLILNSFGYQSI